MIVSFKSKKLRNFWEKNESRRIAPEWIDKIAMILDRLDQSVVPEDMDIPGFAFHALKGDRKDQYSVTVQGPWRITFGWEDGDAIDVHLEDYH